MLAFQLGACGFGDVTIVDAPQPESARLLLTIVPSLAPEAAAALGWDAGIPNAQVRLEPIEIRGGAIVSGHTGPDGTIQFDAISVGRYELFVNRLLDPAELVEAVAYGVTGFDGRTHIEVNTPATVYSYAPPAARRRPLVISEFSFNQYFSIGVGTYRAGGFIELYNAADSTVYLDGLVIGNGWSIFTEGGQYTCAATDPMRNDPTGTWAIEFEMFPGSGRDFPLESGNVVLIATDAIDHSALISELLDLSAADFEFFGGAGDVDNPHVPNMIDVGVRPDVLGHGMDFGVSDHTPFIAAGLNPAALLRRNNPVFPQQVYAQIPLDNILEIAVFSADPSFLETLPGWFFCPEATHPNLDLAPARLYKERNHLESYQRKRIGSLPDGRPVLQHTRTSAADFYTGTRTPGWIRLSQPEP